MPVFSNITKFPFWGNVYKSKVSMQLLNLRPNRKFLQFFLKTFHLDDHGTAISHSKLCVSGFWTVFVQWVFLPILFRAIFFALLYVTSRYS